MSQDSRTDGADSGPGSGAAKPITEPPGGSLDRVLNDEPTDEEAADSDEGYVTKDDVGQ